MTMVIAGELLERLKAFFAELPDAVRLIDSGGSLLLRNEAAELLAPDGLGHLCGERGGQRNPSCPACQVAEVFERGTFLRWHVVVPREGESGGDYYEITLNPIWGPNRRVVAVMEIVRDVTATLGLEQYLIGKAESQDDEIRKRSEEAHRLSNELGELRETQTEILERDRLAALNRLVAGVSHEIHTPLGAMLSSADLLRRRVKKLKEACKRLPDDKDRKRMAEKMESLSTSANVMVEGARRIQAVVKTLRLFSRLDEAEMKPVNLHEGLNTSLELLQYRTGDRIKIVKKYGKLPELICRPDALNQVFMNLLLNAVQAIPNQGQIRIATRHVEGEIRIEITDSGVGIPENERAKIFDLGYTTKGGTGGAGIGLALTRRIVHEHDGSIEVSGDPGKGTTFTVRLPVNPVGQEKSR